jgi:Skp family chaperone for outer membrane proteins
MSSEEVNLILERLDKIETSQRSMETGIMNLGTRLEALENKVEERLQDTRPLWSGVQTQIEGLRADMQTQMEGLRADTQTRIESLREEMQTRIESLREEMQTRIESLREEMQTRIESLREEMQKGFHLLDKKFELVQEDVVNVRVKQRFLEKEVDEIKKAS